MNVYILASGSKGNATIIESKGRVILIDMGISLRTLNNRLIDTPISFQDIEAVLVTHNHSDHISNLYRFDKSMIYCSKGTYDVDSSNYLKPFNTYNIKGFEITVLPTSHDAPNSIGFVIKDDNEKLAYMTDTGYVSMKNIDLMKNPDYLLLESNHDVRMLLNSSRPPLLIKRIIGDQGHLSNVDSASYAAEIIGDKTKQIVLMHLSEETNTESLALDSYKKVFAEKHVSLNGISLLAARQKEVIVVKNRKKEHI